MGHSRWDSSVYSSYSSAVRTMSSNQIFRESGIHQSMDPKGVAFRESRDSENHPSSTPIAIGLDVTGSMGYIPEYMVKIGLGTMMDSILQRRPVADPAVMIMAIGDALHDNAPLQVGQFESDIVIANWLEKIWLEGYGGGNDFESYDLAYYFAIYHTKTDSFEKRNTPGVIITIGDEMPNLLTRSKDVKRIMNSNIQSDIRFVDLVEAVRPTYTPYHIIIAEGSFASRNIDRVTSAWREILGPAAVVLSDHTKTPELIVTMLDIDAGRSVDDALSVWDTGTSTILRSALLHYIESGAARLSRRIDRRRI